MAWQIGNGQWAKLWEDSWGGRQVLGADNELEAVKNLIVQHWGHKVCAYMEVSSTSYGEEWKWKSLENLDIADHHKLQMLDIFIDRHKLITRRADKLIDGQPKVARTWCKLGIMC